MIKITGILKGVENLKKKFRLMRARYGKKPQDVLIGYGGVPYTIYVHEDLTKKHAPGKQAKFLEMPARAMQQQLGELIGHLVETGVPLQEAMLIAGHVLQEVSQSIVPVATRALHDSAYTVLAKDRDEANARGYAQYLRKLTLAKARKP